MANQNQQGLKRIWKAGSYSMAGIRTCWNNEAAFRQELILGLILGAAAFWVGETAIQQTLLIGSCIIVLITELLNSAIEAAIDRISEDRHRLSGRAKDMGSAAVFFSLVLVIVTWALIAFERFGT